MRLLQRSVSICVGALLLAVLVPAVPASARPYRASRPARALQPRRTTVRTLAADDDFPGVVLPPSPVNDTLDEFTDVDDVYRVDLKAGQMLNVSLTGAAGTDFTAVIYAAPVPGGPQSVASADPLWESWGPNADGTGYPQDIGLGNLNGWVAGSDGTYYLDIYAISGAGAYSFTWSITDGPVTMRRLAGGSRYATGLAISSQWGDGSSPTVILATGSNFADALAASALAGTYGCPILLTTPTSLWPGLLGEIDRLRGLSPAKVFIVGGEKAVYPAVANALTAHGNVTVQRLGGENRYETAALIGAEVKRHETVDLHNAWSGDAFVVKGTDFPDALAASPIAANRKMPILLVTPTAIPPATANAIKGLGVTNAYITGSTIAVSDWVKTHLGTTATRIPSEGAGRYGTAKGIASYAVAQGWATPTMVGLSTGQNFPDALGGGALVGKNGGVLLLVNPADYAGAPPTVAPPWWTWVYDHKTAVTNMRVFGSYKAVDDWVFMDFLNVYEMP